MAIDQSANNTTLHVSVGDELKLSLPETRTAGFTWQIVSPENDVLRVRDEGFERAPQVGGTGVHRWSVTGVRAGSAALEMAYARSWELADAKQRFKVRIEIAA